MNYLQEKRENEIPAIAKQTWINLCTQVSEKKDL